MSTSKFSWILISLLIGMLVLTNFLSIPVQAKSEAGEVQQSGDPAGKPPTKTKRQAKATSAPKTTVPKSTPVPKTATPKPTNTVAIATTVVPTSSAILADSGTGTPADTVTPLPTFTFSSDMSTAVSQLTATSGVIYLTSTSAALTATSTPTNIGAPTSTPNNLEQTATSIVLTTVPTSMDGQPTVTLLAGISIVHQEIPVTSGQSTPSQPSYRIFFIWGIGVVILVVLLYLLSRELKRSTVKNK